MKKFLMSFVYAWRGIIVGMAQRNLRVHFLATVAVLLAGLYFQVSLLEWVALIMMISLVWSAELVNTAIEDGANIMRDELGAPYSKMGKAKDLAAGAVLVLAIGAVAVGALIFVPRIVDLLVRLV